jgi:hypothetical protein
MIRLTDQQWERIRDHFPEENIGDGRQIACCGVLFILSSYFKAGVNKLVDLIVELKLPLGELMIDVVARISVCDAL